MKQKYCIPVDIILDKYMFIYYSLSINECEPNFFFRKSEINNFEKTTANPVNFGATHTQTVSGIIRIGWIFSSKSYKTIPINYILLIFNQFTKLNMINVSVCLPIKKEWNIHFIKICLTNNKVCLYRQVLLIFWKCGCCRQFCF